MRFTTALTATAALLAPLARAASNAIVFNNCTAPIYLWSVGSTIGPQVTIAPSANYTEPFRVDTNSGGIALKITRVENGLYSGAPQTIFAYNLQGNGVWYDLSDVFGDPFSGSRVEIVPSDDTCSEIIWEDGVPPGGSEVRVCQSTTDLTLRTC